jgi:hypothetical protein
MTALHKLGAAAAIVIAGIEIAALAAIAAETTTHPAAAVSAEIALGAAAAVIALTVAVGQADQAARTRGADIGQDDTPPAARTPLFEQPADAERHAAFMNGHEIGYEHGWDEGYEAGYTAGAAPSTARHGTPESAQTLIMPVPDYTQEIPRIDPAALVDDPEPGPWPVPVTLATDDEDLYAHQAAA